MIIFLPIKIQPTGGTSTFAKKFQSGMRRKGHTVVFKFQPNYDALLVSPRCLWRYLLHAKLKRKPIIHRLDGTYYPATIAGWLFPLYNLPLIIIRWFFANSTIYQSNYSKKCCDLFLGKKKKKITIIYNGVDTNLFSPNGPQVNLKDNPQQHVFITASKFRRRDQIIPLLKAFKIYRQQHEHNAKLVIIGDFTKEVVNVPELYSQHQNIKLLGVIENPRLPLYLRAADVFVFTHQNPPCPNNVIEAIACGLPICGIADGAMPELVQNSINGQLLPVSNNGFLKFRSINIEKFAEQMAYTYNRVSNQKDNTKIQTQFTLLYFINRYYSSF